MLGISAKWNSRQSKCQRIGLLARKRLFCIYILVKLGRSVQSAPRQSGTRRMTQLSSTGLPDFDTLWDYAQPGETEERFRELLPAARASGDRNYHLQLLTQIARAQ